MNDNDIENITSPDPIQTDLDNSQWPRSVGWWAVALYLVLFIIRPWEILIPWLAEIRFERAYAIAMLAVVLMTGRRFRMTAQCWWVALFAGVTTLSAIFAWRPDLSWVPLYRYLTVVVTYFLILAVCFAPRDLFLLVTTFVATMTVYISKALWEYFVHDRHQVAQGVSRLLGIEETFGEPNAVAMSVVVSLPLWYFLWRRAPYLTVGWDRFASRCQRLVLVIYPVLAAVAVWLTNSRAGMIGFAAFVVLTRIDITRKGRFLKSSVIALVLVTGLWLITPTDQKERMKTLWDPNSGPANAHASAIGRWSGFMAAMQMLNRFPITGVGIGNFLEYRVTYLDGVPKVAHNLPGQILGETGLIGGLVFLAMIGTAWRNNRQLQVIGAENEDSTLVSLRELARANLHTMLLLLLFGLSLHNALRFNWLWIAAFTTLAWDFALPTLSRSADAGRSDMRTLEESLA